MDVSQKNGILVAMPKVFITLIITVLVLPAIAMIFGFKLGVTTYSYQSISIYHALYYWSMTIIVALVVLLACSYYWLTHNKIALSLGVAYLIGTFFYFGFTVSNNWLQPLTQSVENVHQYVWLFTNTLTSFFLVLSLSLGLIKNLKKEQFLIGIGLLFIVFFISNLGWLMSLSFDITKLPQLIYPNKILVHPFGLINLFLNLYLALFLYPQLANEKDTILLIAILYSAITQIVMSCYMVFGSSRILDTAYVAALIMQLSSYLIPFIGLILSYLNGFDSAFASQKKLQDQKDKFERLSTYDSLTELINRRAFEDVCNTLIANYHRYGHNFTLIYLDLDNFKLINDSLGHEFGDELLKEVAFRLKKSIRAGDYCARLGGDEFGIIFAEMINKEKIILVAQNLLHTINAPFNIQNHSLYIGASIGIASYPDAGATYQDLLKNADTAMYEAKKLGRNTYVFYSKDLSKAQLRELEIENYLRKSFHNDEFYLTYQPIYHLADEKIIGAEVLLRWNSDHLGEIEPSEFIKTAEKSGLMVPIGHWVLKNVSQQIHTWWKKYNKTLQFSVNLSSIELTNNDFISILETYITAQQKGSFALELTEKVLLENQQKIEANLRTLTKLGVNLVLDNFGTGYSSFLLLKNLPISSLKIDQSFITDIDLLNDTAILKAILRMARELDKSVIAKGIETERQLKFLIEHGCDLGQGHLLSKPLPAKQFEALVFGDS